MDAEQDSRPYPPGPGPTAVSSEQRVPTPDELNKRIQDIGSRIEAVSTVMRLIDEFLYSGLRSLPDAEGEGDIPQMKITTSPLIEIDNEMGRVEDMVGYITESLNRTLRVLGLEEER